MSVDGSLAKLRELALALPRPGCDWEETPTFGPPATEQSLAKLERVAGFILPAAVRTFFTLNDSIIGMSVHNGSAERGDFPRTVSSQKAIPIATDGGGNAFVLAENGSVWRWDHESERVVQVSSSFEVFLERVTADWAAFVAGTPDWTFLM